MIALDISLLNLKSPYYVVQDADGDLLFETDYGVKYGISFELNEGMMNYPAYEFGILNKNGQPSPNDRKLRDTILAIIEEFFRANGGVLLYICAMLQATVCRSIASTCSCAGSTPTNTATYMRSVPLRM